MKSDPQYGKTDAKPQVAVRPYDHAAAKHAMKFAICNETFGDRSFADTFSTIRKLGYTGVEIAPFTFAPHDEPFDVRQRAGGADCRSRARWPRTPGSRSSACTGCWRRRTGYYLTSPDPTVRRRTADYLRVAGRSVRRPGRQDHGARLTQAAEPAAGRFVRRCRGVRRRSAARGDCRRARSSA